MNPDYATFEKLYEEKFDQQKLTLSSVYTQKINARSSVRTGVIVSRPGYSLKKGEKVKDNFVDYINIKGTTSTAQAFFQVSHKLTSRLSVNAGLHYLQLFLNNSNSIEPRAALRFESSVKNIWTAGYGLHGQTQPIGVYFARSNDASGNVTIPNKNLGFSKAHHFVMGYDRVLNTYSHLKTEVYYQHLFNIPVSADQSETFSMLNVYDGYYTNPLVNKGLGRNCGIELTYERFLHRDFYYLVSMSLYDSRFRAANGEWYNTRFNTNFALAITAGKEWQLKGSRNRLLGVNLKSLYVGGFRYTPIDLPASVAAGETKYNDAATYALQNPAYYRLDLRVSLKRNYEKLTTTLALDIQNTTNRKNVGGQYYDKLTGSVKYWYQAPLLPILSYRLEF
jgi:hypothetical protein